MEEFPHHYSVSARAGAEGDIGIESDGLPALSTAPPAEFGGPGDRWSPETLLVASVANCFILTFRAVARASQFSWLELDCHAEGVLDKVDANSRFTEFTVRASLRVPADSNEERALRLLALAEKNCLITNSMTADVHLEAEIEYAA
jgi:peroxiredoxin-like protein